MVSAFLKKEDKNEFQYFFFFFLSDYTTHKTSTIWQKLNKYFFFFSLINIQECMNRIVRRQRMFIFIGLASSYTV